ncbi:glycoside hydrolase family 13 protein [Nonomuraea sp. KC401]|uniref:glycoside hydrolase family 13 protein n=1 Tax=unclassified Nonomuraea TaxID=2593643 RepID=UPI0010FEED20|nr:MULTISPECIES: glycoside hydrolase family 13 protein [unclassified Nonomuraea]NBE98740.1 alpha-amylase [Nonomuraea sp. K271]TLF59706.1 glycoside hydrolase family 13 protein [Nonomuraea sp. KC401]
MDIPWWRDAVVYEIYVRSFADSSGDGVGDLAGVRERLPYLRDLGVDAVWLTPFYTSPMADGGYDVADHRDVDPLFGTLSDFEALVAAAHDHGLRVIVDIVPNHSSSAHPWFQAALRGEGRERYLFRDRTNNWKSTFGGSAWTRVEDGSYYLHLFAPEQPDFNWRNPEVHGEFLDILRFWLDRGVDGFRIDVAMGLYKAEGLPDIGDQSFKAVSPVWGQPEVHDVYRDWRRVLDGYPGERMAVGEVWTDSLEDLALYVRPDELHQSFNFAWLQAPWSAAAFRKVIDDTLSSVPFATWVLSNHDVVRHRTRYAADDPAAGPARAKAAVLTMLALPGSAYLYQGEELGLPEVTDLPDAARQDPIFYQSNGELPGRDGCRVPIPWTVDPPSHGFSPGAVPPWLPQPAAFAELSVEKQEGDTGSTLEFYRRALACRRDLVRSIPYTLEWLKSPEGVLFFTRGPLICALNCGNRPVRLPEHDEVLLASGPLRGDLLPPDTAAWLRRAS